MPKKADPRRWRELRWMVGFLPLGFMRMDAPVDSVDTVLDASGEHGGYGYAVVESHADPGLLAQVFRVNERWRFRELLPHELLQKGDHTVPKVFPHRGPLPANEKELELHQSVCVEQTAGFVASPVDVRAPLDHFVDARQEDEGCIDHHLVPQLRRKAVVAGGTR